MHGLLHAMRMWLSVHREMWKQVKTHITEHKKAVTNADPRNAIAAHVWNTAHNIQFSKTSGMRRIGTGGG